MPSPNRQITFFAQTALITSAWYGLRVMIGYRALALGADPAVLGLITALMAVPAFLGAMPFGRLSDRIGGGRVIMGGLVLMITGTAAMILLPSLIALALTGVCVSAGQTSTIVGQQAYVAGLSTSSRRDRDFGNLSACHAVGQLLGPPLVAAVVSFGSGQHDATVSDTSIGIAATMVCLTLAVLSGIARSRSSHQVVFTPLDRHPSGARAIARTPGVWQCLVASSAVLVTVDLVSAYMPLWAVERGVSVTTVGLLLMVRALCTLISRIGMGRLVDRFGRKRLLILTLACGVIALGVLPLAGQWSAIPAMVLLGLALGIPQPLSMAWIVSITRREDHGAALGLRMTANRLAEVVVPIAVAGPATAMGVAGVFWATAVLMAGAVVVTARAEPDARTDDEPDPPPG